MAPEFKIDYAQLEAVEDWIKKRGGRETRRMVDLGSRTGIWVKSVDEEPLVISRNTDLTLSVSEKHAQELEESGIRLLKEESSAG